MLTVCNIPARVVHGSGVLQFVARFQVDGASLGSPGTSKMFLRAVRAGRGGAEQPVLQTQVRIPTILVGDDLLWCLHVWPRTYRATFV